MASPITAMLVRPIMQRRNARKLAEPAPDGIREEAFVKIGGIDQWITIRGKHRANPVLFIVHGGPGSPYTPFNSWLTGWEEYFTLVQWEERGGGKTFEKNGAAGSGKLTLERLADDGIELAEYLCKHLNQPKIILMGSSVGSIVSIIMAKKRPELFYAYVGTEQNGFPAALRESYALTKAAAEKAQDKKGLALLTAMGSDNTKWTQQQFEAMNKLSIKLSKDVPDMVYDLMLPALMYMPKFTMNDIKMVQKGMEFSMEQLFSQFVNFDLAKLGLDFKIPIFIFQGEGDILTPPKSAKEYLDKIQAPSKTFVLIKNAGHLAEFANPAQFLEELRTRVRPLAVK